MDFLSSLDWMTNPTVLFRQFMAGLANGMLLFLVAAGLSLIFGVCRIINFAHGGFFMLGAYIAFTVVGSTSNSISMFILALVLSTAGLFAFGVAFEALFLRRIYGSPQAFQLLLTFGLVLLLGDAVKLVWGREENSIRRPDRPRGVCPSVRRELSDLPSIPHRGRLGHLHRVLGHALSNSLGNIGARGYRRPRDAPGIGRRCGAVSSRSCSALGSGLAGLAGGLAAPIVSIGPGLHAQVLIDAFVIVVIGGMGSFPGRARWRAADRPGQRVRSVGISLIRDRRSVHRHDGCC